MQVDLTGGGQEECSLMLIQYMDLNLQRLNQILAGKFLINSPWKDSQISLG